MSLDILLPTKTFVPASRVSLLPRTHLSRHFQETLLNPLTLICAPAGAGKTTAITTWYESSAASRVPLAWVSLEDDDSDLLQFVTYVAAALETIQSGILERIAPLTSLPQPPASRVFAATLISQVSRVIDDFLLVLDDYHHITNEEVHHLVSFLIDHMPPQMHIVLSTRADPPLPLARLRARGQMVEIRESDLRFTPDESAQFLRDLFELPLTDAQIAALDARIEGWAAGLKLVALALRGRTQVDDFIAAFTGSHRFVVDYLMEEVFEGQPEDIRQFLLETSFLREMNADLCDSVTGRSGSQVMLDQLVRLNLFTIPLDDSQHWFRYHHLFAEVLKHKQKSLSETMSQTLYHRAATWYVTQGQYQPAMSYFLEAQAYSDAAQFIAERGYEVVEHEGYEIPLRWLKHIPAAALGTMPDLLVFAVMMYLKTNRSHSPEVRRLLDQAEASASETSGAAAQMLQAKIDMIKSILAQEVDHDLEASNQFLDGAMRYLVDDPVWYINGTMQKSWLHLLDGEAEAALDTALGIIPLAEQQGSVNAIMEAYKIAGIALQYQGRFTEAVRVLESAVNKANAWGQSYHIELGNVYFNIARIALLRGELARAEQYTHHTLNISERLGIVALSIAAWLHLAEVEWFLGKAHAARDNLLKAQTAFEEYPEIDAPVEKSTAAFISTLLGDLDSARQWVQTSVMNLRPSPAELEQHFRDIPSLLLSLQLLHVLIADLSVSEQPLSQWDSVLLWAESIHQISIQRNAALWEIRALNLIATAHHACGNIEEAFEALRAALTLAEPERLLYPFVAGHRPMHDLLKKLHQHGEITPFSSAVLAALEAIIHSTDAAPSPNPQIPFEALTEREREVLLLVAEGYSNGGIAQKLYLSVGTVKRHIANIFIKLGAESRTHALAIAREHGLI